MSPRYGRTMSATALVTGAAGFAGGHLVGRLIADGWNVVTTDLDPSARAEYYAPANSVLGPRYDHGVLEATTSFVPCDITDPSDLDRVFDGRDIDVVFHLASMFDYFAEWETLYEVNVEGARNVGEAAVVHGVDHFVGFSTLGVLSGADFDGPNNETAPYSPHNRYCESKLAQERTLQELHDQAGLPVTVVRPFPIYGPGSTYGIFHIPYIIAKFGFAPVWRIYPRRKQLKFPSVHVDDLCRAAIFLAERPAKTIGETYNVGSRCIDQDALIGFLGDALNVPTRHLPIPHLLYHLMSRYAQWHGRRLHQAAKARGVRPKVEAPMTYYLTSNMWFSNAKIRDLGFEFTYLDPRRGLWSYLTWCKQEGLLP